jgi:hypothetical protein
VGLEQVWIRTIDDGLVRADHVVEVLAHKTAPFAGKPAHWLVDVVTGTSQGAGSSQQWNLGASHRTLIQTDERPHGAAQRLAGLLAALHAADSAGIVTAHRGTESHSPSGARAIVDFRFELFAAVSDLHEALADEPAHSESPDPFL